MWTQHSGRPTLGRRGGWSRGLGGGKGWGIRSVLRGSRDPTTTASPERTNLCTRRNTNREFGRDSLTRNICHYIFLFVCLWSFLVFECLPLVSKYTSSEGRASTAIPVSFANFNCRFSILPRRHCLSTEVHIIWRRRAKSVKVCGSNPLTVQPETFSNFRLPVRMWRRVWFFVFLHVSWYFPLIGQKSCRVLLCSTFFRITSVACMVCWVGQCWPNLGHVGESNSVSKFSTSTLRNSAFISVCHIVAFVCLCCSVCLVVFGTSRLNSTMLSLKTSDASFHSLESKDLVLVLLTCVGVQSSTCFLMLPGTLVSSKTILPASWVETS